MRRQRLEEQHSQCTFLSPDPTGDDYLDCFDMPATNSFLPLDINPDSYPGIPHSISCQSEQLDESKDLEKVFKPYESFPIRVSRSTSLKRYVNMESLTKASKLPESFSPLSELLVDPEKVCELGKPEKIFKPSELFHLRVSRFMNMKSYVNMESLNKVISRPTPSSKEKPSSSKCSEREEHHKRKEGAEIREGPRKGRKN